MTENYSVSQYISDIRAVVGEETDEKIITTRISPLSKRLAASPDFMKDEYRIYDEVQGFGVCMLHEEENHDLSVFVMSWLPDRGTLPHNHLTWAVVASIEVKSTKSFGSARMMVRYQAMLRLKKQEKQRCVLVTLLLADPMISTVYGIQVKNYLYLYIPMVDTLITPVGQNLIRKLILNWNMLLLLKTNKCSISSVQRVSDFLNGLVARSGQYGTVE